MKTVILAGGLGTRIRDVADNIPKPMITVGGQPILQHIMSGYAAAGFHKFVVALGYRGDVIKQYFLNYSASTHDLTVTLGKKTNVVFHENNVPSADGWEITLAETGLKTMTGGRIWRIRKYVEDDDTFMLTYGDGVANVDVKELIAFHRKHGKVLTVTGVYPPSRFGEITVKNETEVVGFNEKPQTSGGLISGGFFVCNRRIFDYLDSNEELVFEQEPMKAMTADGQVAVFHHRGFWHPMDTYRDYLYLNDLWDKGTAPWKTW